MKKLFFLLLICFINNAFADNPMQAKVIELKNEKNKSFDYSVKIVQTNYSEINRKLEQQFCGSWSHLLEKVEKIEEEKKCLHKNIHQAIDEELNALKEYTKENNNTYTYKSFEQSYHYIGKHYFQLCSYDYNRGSFFGNQSLVYCFMYDIQNLKKPTLLKENGIFDFLNEKQKNKLIDLIIKNNPDKFQQQTDMISDIANIIIENKSNKNNYLLKINYYAYYGQLRYIEFNIPEEILRTIIPNKFFPNLP